MPRIQVFHYATYDRIRRFSPEQSIDDGGLIAFIEGKEEADRPIVYFYFAGLHFFTILVGRIGKE